MSKMHSNQIKHLAYILFYNTTLNLLEGLQRNIQPAQLKSLNLISQHIPLKDFKRIFLSPWGTQASS